MPPVVTRHSAPYPGRLATLLVLVLALLCAAPRTMANPIEDAQVLLNVTFNAASQQLTLACYLKPAKACYNSVISLYKTTLAIPSKAPSTLTLMERSQLTETGTTHFSGRKSSIEVSDFDPSEVWCFNKLTFDASETDSGDYSCGATYVFRNQKYTVQQSEVTAVRTVSTPVVKMLNIQQTYVLNENETSKEIECQVKTSNTEKVQVQFMLGDTDMTSSFPQVDSSQEDNGGINNPIPSLITYTRLYRGTIDVSQELRDKRLKCSATLQLDAPTANSLQVLVGSNKASEEDAVLFVATPEQGQHEQPGFVDCTNHSVEARLGDVIVMSCAIAKASTERASFWWTVINGENIQTCNSTDTCTQVSSALSFVEERNGLQVRLSLNVKLDSSNSKWRYKVSGTFLNRELSTDEFKVSVVPVPNYSAAMGGNGSLLTCSQLLLSLCHLLLLTLAGLARVH